MTMEDELVSAANLVAEEYSELRDKDPQNELLGLVEVTTTTVRVLPERRKEFNDRFPPVNPNSGYMHFVYSLTNYYNALCRALGKHPGFAELTDELRKKYGLKTSSNQR